MGTQGPLRNIARKRLPVKGVAADDGPGGSLPDEQQAFRHSPARGPRLKSLRCFCIG
jgi:hypothetical protein